MREDGSREARLTDLPVRKTQSAGVVASGVRGMTDDTQKPVFIVGL